MTALAMAAMSAQLYAIPAERREKPAGIGAEARRVKRKAEKLARRKNRPKKLGKSHG